MTTQLKKREIDAHKGSVEPPWNGRPRSKKATRAMVLAGIGALFGWLVLPLLSSIAAVVVGIRARREIRANPALKGKGMATVAILIGVVAFLFWVLALGLLLLSIGAGGGGFAGP